jgi:DNA replication and repair protein RecF
VIYAPKNMPARDASTGEQKALLIGLILAHATLVAEMTGITPLLLLDEVVAHLDPDRRKSLFGELSKLGAQVWMTGADPVAFAEIGPSGEIFDVANGHIARRQPAG